MKSLLYAVNTNTQSVSVGGTVNFGSAIRRCGNNCTISDGNPVVSGTGFYTYTTNLTVTAEAAGTLNATLYKDGVVVPGASAQLTVADGSIYTLTVPAVIKEFSCCCNPTSTLTLVLTGVATTVNSAAVIVEKQ